MRTCTKWLFGVLMTLTLGAADAREPYWLSDWCSFHDIPPLEDGEKFDRFRTPIAVTTRSRLFSGPSENEPIEDIPSQNFYLSSPKSVANGNIEIIASGTGTLFWADPLTVLCAPESLIDPGSRVSLRFISFGENPSISAIYALDDTQVLIGPEEQRLASVAPVLEWVDREKGYLWRTGLGLRQPKCKIGQSVPCRFEGLLSRHHPILETSIGGLIVLIPPADMTVGKAITREMNFDELSNIPVDELVLQRQAEDLRSSEITIDFIQDPATSKDCIPKKFRNVWTGEFLNKILTEKDREGELTIPDRLCSFWDFLAAYLDRPAAYHKIGWTGHSETIFHKRNVNDYYWLPYHWRSERLFANSPNLLVRQFRSLTE